MMWAALRESDIDEFMRAPMEEVTRHLVRERGDRYESEDAGGRRSGYPASFSLDPTSIARPLHIGRHF